MQTVKLFKRTAALFAAIAVAAVSAAVAAFADGAPLGSGTEADPYIIRNGAELVKIGGSEDGVGYITLANDIDLSYYQGQTCIIKKLTGKLDGAGHKITGLKLTSATGSGWSLNKTGLIGELSGNVENLTISGADITIARFAEIGILAAYIPQNSTVNIKNCTVTGEISGTASNSSGIGAFIGNAFGSIEKIATIGFDSCISNVGITCASADFVGGIIGKATSFCDLTVARSAVIGNITAANPCGILGNFTMQANCIITIKDSYVGSALTGKNKCSIAYNSKGVPTTVNCSGFYYDTDYNKNLQPFYNKWGDEVAIPGASGVTTAEIMALASTLDGFEASDEFGGYPVPKQQTAAAFSVTVDGSNVNITAAKAGSYSLVLASYFGDALADVKIQTVTFANDGDGQTVSVPDGFTADGRTFRAMLWSGMCPLAKSNN